MENPLGVWYRIGQSIGVWDHSKVKNPCIRETRQGGEGSLFQGTMTEGGSTTTTAEK